MQKTKLEMYVGVLKILAQNDSVKTTNVADSLNVRTHELKIYLAFLLKQDLVEERKLSNNGVVYLITQRGRKVLRYFKELKQELPIIR
jgi:predicted transcriptional regulator